MPYLSRLFIVYLFVFHFFDTQAMGESSNTDTSSNGGVGFSGYPPANACTNIMSSITSTAKSLSDKCGGVVLDDCIKMAGECVAKDEESPDGVASLMNAIQGPLMAGLAGGFPVASSSSPNAFKCMPSTRIDKITSNIKEMQKEASETEKRTKEYKRKIEEKKEELNDKITEMKKDFTRTIKDTKAREAELKVKEKELREAAAAKTEELLEQIRKQELGVASAMAEIEMKETERGDLYINTIGTCAKELEAEKDKTLADYDKAIQELQAELGKINDLNAKYKVKSEFKTQMKNRQKLLQTQYAKRYNQCLETQTKAYKFNYQKISNEIKSYSSGVVALKEQIENNLKKVQQVPTDLNTDLQSLKDVSNAERESNINDMMAAQASINQSIENYRVQESTANAEYQQAYLKLNMAQMQQSSNQAAFHMNTFGDAAPIVGTWKELREMACESCKGKESPGWCKTSSGSRNNKSSNKSGER